MKPPDATREQTDPGTGSLPYKDHKPVKLGRCWENVTHAGNYRGRSLGKGKKKIKLHRRKAGHGENPKPVLLLGELK